MEKNETLAMGLWKFHERVPHSELVTIADEWAKDDNYLQLYIRKVSKDQHGIGFTYKHAGTKESYKKYFHDTSDLLKRKFGNDLVGWDIASSAAVIKA